MVFPKFTKNIRKFGSISAICLLDLRGLSVIKIWLRHLLADLFGGQGNLRQDGSTLGHESVVIGLVVDGYFLPGGIEVGVGAADLEVLIFGALVPDHRLLSPVGAVLAKVGEVVGSVLTGTLD